MLQEEPPRFTLSKASAGTPLSWYLIVKGGGRGLDRILLNINSIQITRPKRKYWFWPNGVKIYTVIGQFTNSNDRETMNIVKCYLWPKRKNSSNTVNCCKMRTFSLKPKKWYLYICILILHANILVFAVSKSSLGFLYLYFDNMTWRIVMILSVSMHGHKHQSIFKHQNFKCKLCLSIICQIWTNKTNVGVIKTVFLATLIFVLIKKILSHWA